MRKNIRRKVAERNYLEPESSTWLNKSASLRKAGYSSSYAEGKGARMLDDIALTDKDLANFEALVEDLPELVTVTRRKIRQLKKSDNISAKDYSVVLRHIELISKFAGVLKKTIYREERIIKIEIPKEVVKEEYRRIKKAESEEIKPKEKH